MNKFAIILLNLILLSPVFAGNVTQQQDTPVFTDQDLEKYKKISDPYLSPQHLDNEKKEIIKKDSLEGTGATKSDDNEVKNELSESEKKAIEREFNTIVASMLSHLKAGNIEGALDFFVESRKDKHRQIFKALKDNNTLRVAAEGYVGLEIRWIYEHLAECDIDRKENGQIYSYPITFMEVEKDFWKIYDL